MQLATDLDLLFLEPALLVQCRAQAILVWAATATVTGTSITVSGATFTSNVPYAATGMLVYFTSSGATAGVIGIASNTQLTATLPNPGLANVDGAWTGPRASLTVSGDVAIEVYTFPQLRAATGQVLAEVGLDEGQLPGTDALRGACAHAALAMIFRSMAAFDRSTYGIDGKPTTLTPNAQWQTLADAHDAARLLALRAARLSVDRNADGSVDFTGSAGLPRIQRR